MALPRYVEVETSRRCNRTCGWCPNGEHTARRVQELMDWSLFTRMIEQLVDVDYGGFSAFHNYNEPLLSGRILDEVRHVKAQLRPAKPAIYTNGDVLDASLFGRLLDAGVAYLRVTRYPRPGRYATFVCGGQGVAAPERPGRRCPVDVRSGPAGAGRDLRGWDGQDRGDRAQDPQRVQQPRRLGDHAAAAGQATHRPVLHDRDLGGDRLPGAHEDVLLRVPGDVRTRSVHRR